MKKVYLLLTIIFIGSYTSAQVCEDFLKDGKEAYNKGRFSKAKEFFVEGSKKCGTKDFEYWINECDKKIKQTKPSPNTLLAPLPPSPCSTLMQKGREEYNLNNYEDAKGYFKSARELGCSEADGWIEKIEKTEKEVPCKSVMENGEYYYNMEEYAMALTYFESAANNGCFGADMWIQICKDYIVLTAPLDLTDVKRIINLEVSSHSTQSFDNGDYLGEAFHTKRNGIGIYIWSNGSIYIGGFQNGYRSGNGIYMVQDGYILPNCADCVFYVGEWENDRRKGTGFCYDETGKLIYYGNFANNMPLDDYPSTNDLASYGFEVIRYATDKYLGQTKDGKAHGKGIHFEDKGSMWYGQWDNGARAGYGIEIMKNGDIKTGYWTGNTYRSTK